MKNHAQPLKNYLGCGKVLIAVHSLDGACETDTPPEQLLFRSLTIA